MKPFNIELAKQGYPVCTIEEKEVRVLCFDRLHDGEQDILALFKEGESEFVITTNSEGVTTSSLDRYNNLMMTGEEPDHISSASEFLRKLQDQLNLLNSWDVPIMVNGKLIKSVELTDDLTIKIETL